MIRLLILSLFCLVLSSATSEIDEARLNYRNLLKNPGAENGKAGVAVSNTANLAISTTASEVARGKASFHWTPTAASETILFGVASPDAEVDSGSCLASGLIKPDANYSTGIIVARVENGGSPLTQDVDLGPLTAGEWKPFHLAFICPSSGSVDLEFEVTAVSGFKIDSLWLGKDYRVGSTAPVVTAWKSFTPAWTNAPTRSTEEYYYRRIGENMEIQVNVVFNAVGAGGQVEIDIPDGKNILNPTTEGSSTAGVWGSGGYHDISAGVRTSVRPYQAAGGQSLAFIVSETIQGLDGADIGSGDTLTFSVTVPILEWQGTGTTETVTLETQGWRVRGEIGGALVGLSIVDSFSYSVINNGSLDMQLAPGSADAKITCSAAPATGLTCSGNEQVGVNFIAPYAGDYRVCMDFAAEHRNAAGELLSNAFKIVVKSNSDDTVLQDNNIAQLHGSNITTGDIQPFNYHRVCETYTLPAGEASFSLRYFTAVTGTPVLNNLFISRSATFGEPVLGFEILPLTQNFPQAVAIANVETGAGNAGCSNGNICSGEVDLTFDSETLITVADVTAKYFRVGNHVTLSFRTSATPAAHADKAAWLSSINPVPFLTGNFADAFQAGGSCSFDQAGANSLGAQVLSITGQQRIQVAGRYDGTAITSAAISCQITYEIQ